jgi:hypothetical protein
MLPKTRQKMFSVGLRMLVEMFGVQLTMQAMQ